nr:udp-glycosyltransferase 74f2 [Quercus suber]POF11777.1 udp-glycosyltransferase 74f2 [Quercus suber]
MEETEYRGHVVVLPYPSQGHINPLLQFAKRLASKGIKATIATTRYTLKSICTANVGVEPISDGFDESGFAQAKNVDSFLKSFKANGSRTLSELIQKFQDSGSPVSCVVYDSFLPWALDVAKQHGIYGAPFFTNSATVTHIFCLIHHGKLSLPLKLETTPLLIPGLPPLNSPDLPSFLKLPESYPAYLAMKLSQFSNLDMADWIFSNTFEELEAEEARSISKLWPAKLIGPMVPAAYLDDAKFVEEIWGVGLRAKEDDQGVVRKEELVMCLKEATEGERSQQIKKNASKWRELAKKAVSEGGSSDKNINEFVQHLVQKDRQ